MIDMLDSFVNTKSNLSVSYTDANGDLSKYCKIFSIKKGYASVNFFDGLFKITTFSSGVFSESELFVKVKMFDTTYPNAIILTKGIKNVSLYYKITDTGYDIYLKINSNYTVFNIQTLKANTDSLFYTDKNNFETISDTTNLVEITSKIRRISAVTLQDGFTIKDSVNTITRDNNVVNIRLKIEGTFTTNGIIATIDNDYRPNYYQEVLCMCSSDTEILGTGLVLIGGNGNITIGYVQAGTTSLSISHTYIAMYEI